MWRLASGCSGNYWAVRTCASTAWPPRRPNRDEKNRPGRPAAFSAESLLSFDFIGAVQVSWGGAEVVAYNQHGHWDTETFIVHADTNLVRLQFFNGSGSYS